MENKAFHLDIYFLETMLASNFRVYSFNSNTKLHAKYTDAIFGIQFYRRYILSISKNLNQLLVLGLSCSQVVQDTFYT